MKPEPEAESAIIALSNRYTDAVNHRDWPAYRACWTDDGVWELGTPVNQRKEGIEAIITEVQHAVGAMDLFVQMNHAVAVLSVDGDTARARSTIHEIGRIKPESRDLLDGVDGMSILALYDDELRRGSDGTWRFSRRTYQVALFDGHAPKGDVSPQP